MPLHQDIVIAGSGLITPIGLSVAESAASARARVARLREIAWLDRRGQPFIVGSVPDAALPDLSPKLSHLALQYRAARMLRLAHAALEEAMQPLSAVRGALPVPLLLALPEHHTTQALDVRSFISLMARQVDGLDTERSLGAALGRAASLSALEMAASLLTTGPSKWVLVGGVDSLVDPYVLGTLDREQRIRNEVTSDGLRPSEGAAFLLLTLAGTARAANITPQASLLSSARGHEAGHLYSEESYLGEGLAATLGQLLAEPPAQPIGSVFNSFNGERYWAREFSVARTRSAHAFAPDHQMEHPAESFGDLGAAHGAALAVLAAHGLQRGYIRPPGLVYAPSDRGERAAAILDTVS